MGFPVEVCGWKHCEDQHQCVTFGRVPKTEVIEKQSTAMLEPYVQNIEQLICGHIRILFMVLITGMFSSFFNGDRENGRNSVDIQCRTLLISELTPGHDKWMIKARVTSKSQKLSRSKTWHIGTFFKLCLADESGEIEAIAFGDHLVEKYFDIIEVNNVYCLSSLTVHASSKPSLPNSNYELTFNNNTEAVLCKEVPQISYNFVPISEIKNRDKGSFVDIIGICVQTTDFEETVYSNRPYNDIKRYIILKDKSGETVTVILYGLEAEKFNGSNRPIVAIKRGYVGVEKRILVDSLRINPDIEAAGILREWFNMTQQRV